MTDVYNDKLLVFGGEVVDLLDDVFEGLAVAAEPDFAYCAVMTGYPLASGKHRAEIKITRSCHKLLVKVEVLRLRVGEMCSNRAGVKDAHACIMAARHTNVFECPVC